MVVFGKATVPNTPVGSGRQMIAAYFGHTLGSYYCRALGVEGNLGWYLDFGKSEEAVTCGEERWCHHSWVLWAVLGWVIALGCNMQFGLGKGTLEAERVH